MTETLAIAWSGSLDFTVERAGRSLLGSAASGEGSGKCIPWNRKSIISTSCESGNETAAGGGERASDR